MGVEFLYSSHACLDAPLTNIDCNLEEVPFCETIFDESPLLIKDLCFILCLLHKLLFVLFISRLQPHASHCTIERSKN